MVSASDTRARLRVRRVLINIPGPAALFRRNWKSWPRPAAANPLQPLWPRPTEPVPRTQKFGRGQSPSAGNKSIIKMPKSGVQNGRAPCRALAAAKTRRRRVVARSWPRPTIAQIWGRSEQFVGRGWPRPVFPVPPKHRWGISSRGNATKETCKIDRARRASALFVRVAQARERVRAAAALPARGARALRRWC